MGPGFREHVYRRLLAAALRREGHTVDEEVWLDVRFESDTVTRAVRADMIVNGGVLVELKAAEQWHPVFGWQVISYLKASNSPVGLLFNFNVPLLMKTGFRSYVHPSLLRRAPLP